MHLRCTYKTKFWFEFRSFYFINVELSDFNSFIFIGSGPLGLTSDILQNLKNRCIEVNDQREAAEDDYNVEWQRTARVSVVLLWSL